MRSEEVVVMAMLMMTTDDTMMDMADDMIVMDIINLGNLKLKIYVRNTFRRKNPL